MTVAAGVSVGPLVVAALGTGCCQGELLALTWEDVDLKAGTLTVRRSLAQTKAGFVTKEPKTNASRRTLTLPGFVVEALVAPSELLRLLEALARLGVCLPAETLARWSSAHLLPQSLPPALFDNGPSPGVIGLAVADVGYVLPLVPHPAAGEWRVDGDLPFSAAQVQDGLAALVRESGVPIGRAVPERFAFTFTNPLGQPIGGASMTVAAVLSVLRHLDGGKSPLLRAAISLVEFQPGGELAAVSDVTAKLDAAHKECGRLSLIVAAPGETIDRDRAEVVWPVKSVADLARHLNDKKLLAPLLEARGPLTRSEAVHVLDRVRRHVRHEHRYREGADLGDRARQCKLAKPEDPAVRIELARLHAEACRHHGRFADAADVSREAWEAVVALGERGCDDDEADAAAEYAASLFSGHRFGEIPALLQRWADAADRDARRFRPLTRVKVWNTLGRGLVVLGDDGWDEWLRRSLELDRRLEDPDNVSRTTHYRAHGYLRRRGAAEAIAALREGRGENFPRAGNTWDAFLRAKLAHLENEEWIDVELERRLGASEKPYSAWLYVQAAARQPRRRPEDAVLRLELAESLLRQEAGGIAGNVCNLFATFLELNVAARLGDSGRWTAARAVARNFLSAAPDHRTYYGLVVDTLPPAPDLSAAEELLDRVPYF